MPASVGALGAADEVAFADPHAVPSVDSWRSSAVVSTRRCGARALRMVSVSPRHEGAPRTRDQRGAIGDPRAILHEAPVGKRVVRGELRQFETGIGERPRVRRLLLACTRGTSSGACFGCIVSASAKEAARPCANE